MRWNSFVGHASATALLIGTAWPSVAFAAHSDPMFGLSTYYRVVATNADAYPNDDESMQETFATGSFSPSLNAAATGDGGNSSSSLGSMTSDLNQTTMSGTGSASANASGSDEHPAGASGIVAETVFFTPARDMIFYLRYDLDATPGDAFSLSQAYLKLQSLAPTPKPLTVQVISDETNGYDRERGGYVGVFKAGVLYQLDVQALSAASDAGAPSSSAEYMFELHIVDTDGDGLLNIWEDEGGIDITGDMSPDIPLDGASNDYKDIYVEYENASSSSIPITALAAVENAFENAPSGLIADASGIRLHVVAGQDSPSAPSTWIDEWGTFKAVKDACIGFQSERDSDKADRYSDARRLTHHFCVFANDGPDGSSGIGEVFGNDFIVYLGPLLTRLSGQAVLNDAVAGTFMHELGHNLGLRHGGGDGVLFKPNYMSVMNYPLQVPWEGNPAIWRLDYSQLDVSLNEANLNEIDGIGASAGIYASWHTYHNVTEYVMGDANTPEAIDSSSQGAIDWNDDGDTTDAGLQIDLNRLVDPSIPDNDPLAPFRAPDSFGEVLTGYCDWCNLHLPFLGDTNYEPGVNGGSARESSDEPPFDSLVVLTQYVNGAYTPCAADFNGDGAVDGMDLAAILASWGSDSSPAQDLNGDGTIDGMDLAALLAAWGACN
jgi:hypothetical protein